MRIIFQLIGGVLLVCTMCLWEIPLDLPWYQVVVGGGLMGIAFRFFEEADKLADEGKNEKSIKPGNDRT